jgi:plastocyanin
MNKRLGVVTAAMWAVAVSVLIGATANQDLPDLTGKMAVEDAVVHFGAMQPQSQPPVKEDHVLIPDEVTIFKGGTVTFVMNGAGHGIAIYPVSKNTTHAHIAEDLCNAPPAPVCVGAATGTLQYLVTDGKGDLIIDTGTRPPENSINFAQGQLWSAGAGMFLIGSSTTSTGTVTLGTEVRYRFEKTGRYLVICMNRAHTINDWMFGFVNVV